MLKYYFIQSIFFVIVFFNISLSQQYETKLICIEKYHVVPKEFNDNYTIDSAFKYFDSLPNKPNGMWIAYFKSDTTKYAFIAQIRFKKINHIVEYYKTDRKKLYGVCSNILRQQEKNYYNFNRAGNKYRWYFSSHSNGLYSTRGHYKNGLENCGWYYYNENGRAIKKIRYKKGKIVKTKEYRKPQWSYFNFIQSLF